MRKEQVRKRGLPPLVQSKQQRGQAPLPDLLFLTQLMKCEVWRQLYFTE